MPGREGRAFPQRVHPHPGCKIGNGQQANIRKGVSVCCQVAPAIKPAFHVIKKLGHALPTALNQFRHLRIINGARERSVVKAW